MREGYWGEPWGPPRQFETPWPYFRFLVRELAPVALLATLADSLGSALVFASSPGALAFEGNPVFTLLWPRFGPQAALPVGTLEFLGDFMFSAWVAMGFWLLWEAGQYVGGSPSGWWRWPALMFACYPFFAVLSWPGALVGLDTWELFPGAFVLVAFLAFVKGWVPPGHLARQRWEA